MQQNLIEKLEQMGFRKVDVIRGYYGNLFLEKHFIARGPLGNSFIRINIGIVEMQKNDNRFSYYVYLEVLNGGLTITKKNELERSFTYQILRRSKLTILRDLVLDNRLIAKMDLVDFEKNYDEYIKITNDLVSISRAIIEQILMYRDDGVTRL